MQRGKKRDKTLNHLRRFTLATENHAIDPKCVQATAVLGRINWLHTYISYIYIILHLPSFSHASLSFLKDT